MCGAAVLSLRASLKTAAQNTNSDSCPLVETIPSLAAPSRIPTKLTTTPKEGNVPKPTERVRGDGGENEQPNVVRFTVVLD